MNRVPSITAALLALAAATLPAQAQFSAEATLRHDGRSAGRAGPLAAAEALEPGLTGGPQRSGWQAMAELRQRLELAEGITLNGNGLLAHEWREGGGDGLAQSRVNELHLGFESGNWRFAAGKKVLGWDVGYAFRPNDVVQQEVRRTQFGQTPEGRPLAMAEWFGSDAAVALVAVNPERWGDGIEPQRGAREAALAARGYWRFGALDLHAFARQGRHTGASAGFAAAWVATDQLELHASLRVFEGHDRWRLAEATGTGGDAAALLAAANPWRLASAGGGRQWLIGAQWTGSSQVSLLAEAWHDGTALSDQAWRDWGTRNAALAALGAQAAVRRPAAGNLAWQASPFDAASLRQDNLFLRAAWQPEDWTVSLDLLFTPADRGRVTTAALQWKTGAWRLDASLRLYSGPADALYAQLPLRRSVILAATRGF